MKTPREELIARTFAESFFKRFLAVLKLLDSTKKIELKFKKVKQTYVSQYFLTFRISTWSAVVLAKG